MNFSRHAELQNPYVCPWYRAAASRLARCHVPCRTPGPLSRWPSHARRAPTPTAGTDSRGGCARSSSLLAPVLPWSGGQVLAPGLELFATDFPSRVPLAQNRDRAVFLGRPAATHEAPEAHPERPQHQEPEENAPEHHPCHPQHHRFTSSL